MTITDTKNREVEEILEDPFMEQETHEQILEQGNMNDTHHSGVWTSIGRKDGSELEAFASKCGISKENALNIKAVLDGETIVSKKVKLLDISEGLQKYEDCFVGQVEVDTADKHAQRQNGQTQSKRHHRGFSFNEGYQHVLLASFVTRTRLEQPKENGVTFGFREVIYVIFPDTKPGLRGVNGGMLMLDGKPLAYRPGFRLMITHYADNNKKPLWARFPAVPRNVGFTGSDQGNSDFGLQLPEFIYEEALEAGATAKELCVAEESYLEAGLNRRTNQSIGFGSNGIAPRRVDLTADAYA